jgi:hypothetical protein
LSPKTFLARGASGPLRGDLHSAQYFHDRLVEFNLTIPMILTVKPETEWATSQAAILTWMWSYLLTTLSYNQRASRELSWLLTSSGKILQGV